MRRRAASIETPKIGSPMRIPIASRNRGSGVLALPSMSTVCTGIDPLIAMGR